MMHECGNAPVSEGKLGFCGKRLRMTTEFRRGVIAAFTCVAFACALSACAGSTKGVARGDYGQGDPKLAAPNPGGGPIDPFLTDGQAVIRALDAIAQKSGRPLRVTSINADGVNGLSVDVQEPKHPINVDHYVVAPDGTLTGPTPVKMMSMDGGPITAAKITAQAFDPNAIAFARLTQTARQAIAKSGYSDARVTQWEIDGIGHDDRHFMYLESARSRPSANIDAHLNIIGMSY
jgi:hypothetical protein